MNKLWLQVLKVLKSLLEIGAIIVGVFLVARTVKNTLNPRRNETVEDAKNTIETVKQKVDSIEQQKQEIEKEHKQILKDKKARDEKAKKYFPNL